MFTQNMLRRLLVIPLLLSVALAAQARTFVLEPLNVDILGETKLIQARDADTLVDMARFFNLGINELSSANPGVDIWLPGEGTQVVVPQSFILPDAPRDGLVLNLAEMRLYYYPALEAHEAPLVMTHPVSIGRPQWQTPEISTRVTQKLVQPAWYPPASVRAEHEANGSPLPWMVPPGPDNPLGDYAILLDIPGYLIHGTNRPYSIGRRVTHGCIRLYPEDIDALFPMIARGTAVHIINQPYKAGLREGRLYIEVHPPFDEDAKPDFKDLLTVVHRTLTANGQRSQLAKLDLQGLYAIFKEARGMPVPLDPLKQEQPVQQEVAKVDAVESNTAQ